MTDGFGTDDGPVPREEMEIPGFPRPKKKEGFAGSLQGHLERLSANAKSIHHVLEALCGGLDRLEKKMDTSSAQVESRLANIVHHMSGEADEDTMSAWSSLGGGGGGLGSPAELGPTLSLRRRSSFGAHMSSFIEGPFHDPPTTLEVELADVGRGGDSGNDVSGTFGGVVDRAKEVAPAGGRNTTAADQTGLSSGDGDVTGALPGATNQEPTAITAVTKEEKNQDLAITAAKNLEDADAARQPPSELGENKLVESSTADRNGSNGESKNRADPSAERLNEILAGAEATNQFHPRRRSNQDDQSDGSSSKTNSARSRDEGEARMLLARMDGPVNGGSEHGEGRAGSGEGSEYPPVALAAEGSVESGGSDARYIARQRWIWAFGRVCQLVRRRKRKQFEIMSQRATDRTVRMGSRVSVVEKRLDETREHLLVVDRLKDKSGAHTTKIQNLGETVTALCKLFGVEDRLERTVQDSQIKLETSFQSDLSDLEARLTRGQQEIEKSLDSDIQGQGAKLEDIDDRYARSEDALRRAEERIGEVQEEVSGVSHSISEIERQLRVDQGRLDTLENLKKAHQRRLSEFRVKLENSTVSAGSAIPIETEPVETDEERIARLLRAAGSATAFLSADLGKVLATSGRGGSDLSSATSTAMNESAAHGESLRAQTAGCNDDDGTDMMEKLRHISVEAAEYSRLCIIKPDDNDVGVFSINAAVERAEFLCGHIEALLSAHGGSKNKNHNNNNNSNHSSSNNRDNIDGELRPTPASAAGREREGSSESNSDTEDKLSANTDVPSIADVVCPNGRKDLVQRLTTARDALLPVIGERTNLGSLRVALLGLTASVETSLKQRQAYDLLEARWEDLSSRLSGLANSVNDIDCSLRSNGQNRRGSALEDDGGGGVTEDDLDDRLGYKADVSWVQRELQRLWEALDSRAMASVAVVASGTTIAGQGDDGSRPRSAPSSNNRTGDTANNKDSSEPETAREEESDVDSSPSLTLNSRVASTLLPSSSSPLIGSGGVHGGVGSQQAEYRSRSSFNEGTSLIKDLLRKTSRLEQQMSSKADNDEVMKALSSVGNKLRKVGVVIPAMQEELSQKIERKDLAKLVALVSSGGTSSDAPPCEHGSGNAPNEDKNSSNTAVLASRLNSKFRCLSCDRPLPALGPPGPPKLNASGLSIAGAGAPRSPQRTKAQPGQQRLGQTAGGSGGNASSRPSSPAVASPTLEDVGDVAGWGSAGGEGSAMTPGRASDGDSAYGNSLKEGAGSRRRHHQLMQQQRGGEQPGGRLEPLGANGEHMAAVLSRYPRMMPPPSRIRTAAGGGIGSRPGSSTGDGYRR